MIAQTGNTNCQVCSSYQKKEIERFLPLLIDLIKIFVRIDFYHDFSPFNEAPPLPIRFYLSAELFIDFLPLGSFNFEPSIIFWELFRDKKYAERVSTTMPRNN